MRNKKRSNIIKKVLLILVGVLFVLCMILNVTGIAGDKTVSPFDESMRKGYLTIGVDKAVMKIPETFEESETLLQIDETTKNNTPYQYFTDEGKLFFDFQKYVVAIQCMGIKDLSDMKYILGEFERQAMIRIDPDKMERIAAGEKDGVLKEIYRCKAEALLDEGLYGNFSGYFSMMQMDHKSYFIFAGLPEGAKGNTDEQDAIQHMIFSGTIHNQNDAINPAAKIEGTDSINYAEMYGITAEPIVNSGEYGYFSVINKSERAEAVEIAGTVKNFSEGEPAEELIQKDIGKTIYKKLSQPKTDHRWILATIEYQTIGYDMTAVPPAIPVRIRDDNGALLDCMVYTLSADYQNNQITIFYELPEKVISYRVCIGVDNGYLSVRNTTGSDDTDSPESTGIKE